MILATAKNTELQHIAFTPYIWTNITPCSGYGQYCIHPRHKKYAYPATTGKMVTNHIKKMERLLPSDF
jgi:hypothetical protein